MASSEKNRLCVFLLFIILLIVFAVFYSPTDALSRPADKTMPPVMQTEK